MIGLVANIESRELRRVEYEQRGLPPENPRASATDDVEGIIALMHEMLGEVFDVKEFTDAQPKILNEFKKRIDPELKFYYWTGANERFRDFELPFLISQLGKALLKDLTASTYPVGVTQESLWQTELPCHKEGSSLLEHNSIEHLLNCRHQHGRQNSDCYVG